MELLAQITSALFGTGLSQHARLITLASAQEGTLPESLMAERFTGREAVNELYAFDVDALSVSTDLDLDQFIGEELTITVLQPDGSRRAWHGLCTEAAWLGADGGVARYRLRLEPALSLLRLRRDSYIFQDKTVQDIVTELLADYPQLRFDFDVTQEQLPRAICTQYRESDLEFLTRLLASEGLNWRFEHDQPDDESQDGQARHKLVIFDAAAQAPDTPGGAALRFHGMRATDTDDAIDRFAAKRRVQANAVSISSWDPAQLLAPSAEQTSSLDAGELPTLAIYDGSGERIASGADAGAAADPHSRLMLQALELDNKLFEGAGAVRRLAAGHTFTLTQHERYPDGGNGFTVLWVEHEARNNFQPQIKSAASVLAEGTYRNTFGCVRDTVAIVPQAAAKPTPSTALGPQTALVVGIADAVAHTTRDHQVRIQFAWQRGAGANAGGMAHNTDEDGNAPGDERSGTWVRVAEALAGPNWGSQFTPRIGTEVLVDFIEGDMDRPVVVAQLYTGADTPPFSAGVDSGANHPGTLSGIHSHNFDGGGYNQWQLDDTQGQVRMRLATSSAATQLNLGYLIHQAPSSPSRGAYRGSGFELRTDAWAVVRGGEGVLLTTAARAAQGSGITSTQMDSLEALQSLKSAQELAQAIGDAATAQNALTSKDAATAHKDFISLLDPKEKGKHAGAVNGQQAAKGKPGSRELDAAQPVEKFGGPLVVMDSAASINWATPASTVLFAGQHLRWVSQGDVQMSAAHTVSSVAANAASFFTHSGGIQAFAANGPVSLQAHTDQLEIVADKSVTVVSVNDSIEIKANQKIVLQAGQSSITLEGGDITFACPGNFTVKGGQHVFDGGGNQAAQFVRLPDSRLKLFDEAFVVRNEETGAVVPNFAYRIVRADGTFERGITDEEGNTHVVRTAERETLSLEADPAPYGDADTPVSEDLVCWTDDYEKEIRVASFGRYYVYGTLQGDPEPHELVSKYKIYVPLRSGPQVVVELRLGVQHIPSKTKQITELGAATVTPDVAARLQQSREAFKSAAYSTWNNKFAIRITDPECGIRTFPVNYRIVWTDALQNSVEDPENGYHYTLQFNEDKVHERVRPDDNIIQLNYSTKTTTLAHEFIHCFGVPDEYSKTKGDAMIVNYYQPDGELSSNIVVFSKGFKEHENDKRWNIMSSNDSVRTELRHAWNIAIEVSELLQEELGRKVSCEIISA